MGVAKKKKKEIQWVLIIRGGMCYKTLLYGIEIANPEPSFPGEYKPGFMHVCVSRHLI